MNKSHAKLGLGRGHAPTFFQCPVQISFYGVLSLGAVHSSQAGVAALWPESHPCPPPPRAPLASPRPSAAARPLTHSRRDSEPPFAARLGRAPPPRWPVSAAFATRVRWRASAEAPATATFTKTGARFSPTSTRTRLPLSAPASPLACPFSAPRGESSSRARRCSAPPYALRASPQRT